MIERENTALNKKKEETENGGGGGGGSEIEGELVVVGRQGEKRGGRERARDIEIVCEREIESEREKERDSERESESERKGDRQSEREREREKLTTWFVMSLRIASFLRGSIETGFTLTAANDNEIHDIVHLCVYVIALYKYTTCT